MDISLTMEYCDAIDQKLRKVVKVFFFTYLSFGWPTEPFQRGGP